MARSRKKLTYQRRGTLTVEEMVERGMPIRAGCRAVLAERGTDLATWSRSINTNRSAVTRLLSGAPVLYEEVRVALCETFEFDRAWLDAALEKA